MHDSTIKPRIARPAADRLAGSGSFGLFDVLIFSSLWAASVAATLVSVASGALGHSPSAAVAVLAFSGTLVIYNIDRLRDLEHDRATSPERSAFVEEHRRGLQITVALAGFFSLAAAIALPPGVWLLCSAGLVVGLLHRRIKHLAHFKPIYVSLVWMGVVVGLPAVAQGFLPGRLGLVSATLGCAIYANLLASNFETTRVAIDGVRGVGQASRQSRGSALGIAGFGAMLAWLGPSEIAALAAIPGCQAAAIGFYRSDERYSLLVIDGGLLVGGLLSLAIQAAL